MTLKIILTILASLLVLSGCGDEKSTGEKMAESVAKIRGGDSTPDAVINEPIKKISSEEPIKKEVIEEETTKPKEIEMEEEKKVSLKEIAHQAVEEIK